MDRSVTNPRHFDESLRYYNSMQMSLSARVAGVVLIGVLVSKHAGALPPTTHGDELRGIYIVDPSIKNTATAPRADETFRLVYLNRDGGAFTQGGANDPGNNVSTIIPPTATFEKNELSDEEWDDLVRCTIIQFGRFGVTVTESDPGDADHVEAVITTTAAQMNLSANILGVAPKGCGVQERSVVFVFTSAIKSSVQRICETTAQEIAHAYGLDHELECTDPMTYLTGCGEKFFQDKYAKCGEEKADPRDCSCFPSGTQNSVQTLLEYLGPGETEPPTISLATVEKGSEQFPGFKVKASANDNVLVQYVEFSVDGEKKAKVEKPPFEFTTPRDIGLGKHTISARAVDQALNETDSDLSVTVKAECTENDDCDPGLECDDNLCVGALGSPCQDQSNCGDGLSCGTEGNEHLCTQPCASGNKCPSGFACLEGEFGASKCWPADGGGGGCALSFHHRGVLAMLSMFGLCGVMLLVFRRKRAPR